MVHKLVGGTFDGRLNDRDHVIAAYHRHNAEVRRTIAPDRLLVYEAAQGWEPLCDFLGLPVPTTPPPASNSRQEFVARLAKGPPM